MGGEAAGGGGGGDANRMSRKRKGSGHISTPDPSGNDSGGNTTPTNKAPDITTSLNVGVAGVQSIGKVPNGNVDTRGPFSKAADFVGNNPVTSLLGGISGIAIGSQLPGETQRTLGLDSGGVAGHKENFTASGKTTPKTDPKPDTQTGGGSDNDGPSAPPKVGAPTPTTTAGTPTLDPIKKLKQEQARRANAVSRGASTRTQGGGGRAVASLLGEG